MSTQAQAGGGPGNAFERAQAGGVPRIARRLIEEKNKPHHRRGSCWLRGGKEQGTSPLVPSGTKKKKKRAGSELGQGFEVKSPIGRRSSGDRSDRIKPRSLIVLVLPSLAAGPSVHLRSGSYAAGLSQCGGRRLDAPTHFGRRPRRCVSATEEEERSPGTHTEVRPGVVVVVQRSATSSSSVDQD